MVKPKMSDRNEIARKFVFKTCPSIYFLIKTNKKLIISCISSPNLKN